MKRSSDAAPVVSGALRAALPGLAVAALLVAPFLGKAFTIDDPLFMKQAEQVLIDPWRPTAFDVVWSDRPQRMSVIMPSGPVMAWLLVPSVLLGGSEVAAHGVQLALLAVSILATCALALRLDCPPRGARDAGLLLACTPAVLGMTGTAMPDVAAMTFGVLGLERLVAWRDDGRPIQAIAASASLALAVLTRPHTLALLAVGAIGLMRPDERFARRALVTRWSPLVAAPAVAALILTATRDPLGPATSLASAAARFTSWPAIAGNVTAFFAHLTLVLPFALPWAFLHPRRVAGRPVLYGGFALAFLSVFRRIGAVDGAFVAVAAGLGAAALWDALAEGAARRERDRLFLGAWLLVAIPAALYVHLPSKYLLASAPAITILLAQAIAERSDRLGRAALVVALVAGATLGVLILRADTTFAALGRRAAAELIAPEVVAGRRVWFTGHWGFQWYAEKAGARPFTVTPPLPASGDLIVAAAHSGGDLVNRVPRRGPMRSIVDDRAGGRVMDKSAGAGFFSNFYGYYPWAWGAGPADRYDVWRAGP